MRNLSYPEAALAMGCILLGTSLTYLAWFEPAFEQIRSDRQATQTLLFELASERQEIAAKAPREDAAQVANAAPSALEPKRPSARTPKKVISRPGRPRQELELDEGSDPLADLEVK